jgi:hypothetical protein
LKSCYLTHPYFEFWFAPVAVNENNISISVLLVFFFQFVSFTQLFLTRFSMKTGYCNAKVGGRTDRWAGVNFCFPLNNLSLLWPIDTKLGVWVACIKRQLGIVSQVSVIKVKVTVAKNRNSVSAQ